MTTYDNPELERLSRDYEDAFETHLRASVLQLWMNYKAPVGQAVDNATQPRDSQGRFVSRKQAQEQPQTAQKPRQLEPETDCA